MDDNDLKVTDYCADTPEPHEESNLVLDSVQKSMHAIQFLYIIIFFSIYFR